MHGSAGGKSGKFPTQPLGDQPSGDGLTDSPRRDFAHREVFGDRQAEQLRERPCARTDLHPEFEYGARLLPQIVESPPTLEIVKQRFYAPAARVNLNDGLCIQIHFGSQDQASLCPFLPLVVVERKLSKTRGERLRHSGLGSEALFDELGQKRDVIAA